MRFNILFSDDGLETSVQKIFNLQGKNVIELVLLTFQDTKDVKATEESFTFELTFLVVLFKS